VPDSGTGDAAGEIAWSIT